MDRLRSKLDNREGGASSRRSEHRIDMSMKSEEVKTTTSGSQDDDFYELTNKAKNQLEQLNNLLDRYVETFDELVLTADYNEFKGKTSTRTQYVNSINNSIYQIKVNLKALKDESDRESLSKAQRVTRYGKAQAYNKMFLDLVTRYQSYKRDYEKQNKQRLVRQFLIANPNAKQEEIDNAIDGDESYDVFLHAVLKSGRFTNAKNVLNEVTERNKSIIQIEKGISDLLVLIHEINVAIEEQQSTIDSIEEAVESASVYMEEAVYQTDMAIKQVKNTRKKQWIVVLLLLLIAIAAGVTLYIVRSS